MRAFEKAVNDFAAPYKAKLYEERVLMLPPEAQAVIRKPEKTTNGRRTKNRGDYFPILRIDGGQALGSDAGGGGKEYRNCNVS